MIRRSNRKNLRPTTARRPNELPEVPLAGFLYYVPGRSSVTLESAKEVGISHAFERQPSCRAVVANGPDGGSGCIAIDPSWDITPGHYPDDQSWVAAPATECGSPPYWLGFLKEDPPRPEDLAREKQLPGKAITFDSGHQWVVPRLRAQPEDAEWPTWSCNLPRRVILDISGRWVYGEVLERYRELWSWACRTVGIIASEVASEGSAEIASDADACEFASMCLGVNYRVSRVEVAMMGISAEMDATPVIRYALDIDGLAGQLGNHLRRLSPETTDMHSGDERRNMDSQTSGGINQPSAS